MWGNLGVAEAKSISSTIRLSWLWWNEDRYEVTSLAIYRSKQCNERSFFFFFSFPWARKVDMLVLVERICGILWSQIAIRPLRIFNIKFEDRSNIMHRVTLTVWIGGYVLYTNSQIEIYSKTPFGYWAELRWLELISINSSELRW